MHTTCFISAAFFILALTGSPATEAWSLIAPGKTLKVTGNLLDPKNVSGVASVKEGELVIACDELAHGVQSAHLDLNKAEISTEGKEFSLTEDSKKELDLEAVAADPEHHRYYTCGSSSVKRTSGEAAPDRQWLFRIETDPKTGAPLAGKITKVSLKDAISADAFLREHLDKSAADLGIDVEGLAFKDGRLWFGLRSPNVNGWAFVVAASADDLMAKKPVVFQRFELPLGENLGIRDMAPIKGGFLVITGPSGAPMTHPPETATAPEAQETVAKAVSAKAEEETVAKAVPARETVAKAAPASKADIKLSPAPSPPTSESFALYFWPGDTSRPIRIGDLPAPGKPEGLLVVSDTKEKLSVIVFHDGSENGTPLLYDINRPVREEGPVPRNGK